MIRLEGAELVLHERGERCFQLMETDDVRLFDGWIGRRSDLVEFQARDRCVGVAEHVAACRRMDGSLCQALAARAA